MKRLLYLIILVMCLILVPVYSIMARDKIGQIKTIAVREYTDSMLVDIRIAADTAEARNMLSGLERIIALLVGVLAYIVVIVIPLFTAIDICYITIPGFRKKSEDFRNSGTRMGNMANSSTKDGGSKFRFVTDEAIYAIENHSLADGKSALSVYFGKRIWAIVLLAIVLFILIGGQMNVIVRIAINIVSGFMNVLGGLAN